MKLKTKKSKLNFKDGVTAILNAHKIEYSESLISDLEFFFNESFKPDNKTKYWSEIVSQYFSFYQGLNCGQKPIFNPTQATALKKIDKVLMTRYLQNVPDSTWDMHTCLSQHLIFYNEVIKINWYRQNFSIAVIYNNFDMITTQLSNMKREEKQKIDSIFG